MLCDSNIHSNAWRTLTSRETPHCKFLATARALVATWYLFPAGHASGFADFPPLMLTIYAGRLTSPIALCSQANGTAVKHGIKALRGTDLDPNHTHFILVDDGSVEKFGGEIAFRAKFERVSFFATSHEPLCLSAQQHAPMHSLTYPAMIVGMMVVVSAFQLQPPPPSLRPACFSSPSISLTHML